jgi:outer membrane protein assembly factor BamD (BamD/ComL family)
VRRSAPTTPDGKTSSIALEIARIDEIRRTLAADRAKAAITTLQDYRRDFPQGVLRQEADLLSIEAHRRAGDRRRARVLASRFLAEHPESPHSARVRELLDALGPDAR